MTPISGRRAKLKISSHLSKYPGAIVLGLGVLLQENVHHKNTKGTSGSLPRRETAPRRVEVGIFYFTRRHFIFTDAPWMDSLRVQDVTTINTMRSLVLLALTGDTGSPSPVVSFFRQSELVAFNWIGSEQSRNQGILIVFRKKRRTHSLSHKQSQELCQIESDYDIS